mgnify:CR=1 FL=1
MKNIEGKVAFITGGASGAGLGMARVFSKNGMKVVIADSRQDALDEAMVLRTTDLERRLAALNELRGDVVKDRDQFVRKEAYDFAHRALEVQTQNVDGKVNLIINRLTAIETRAVTWTASVALFFMVLQVVLHFWGPK